MKFVIVEPGTPVFIEDGVPSTSGILGGTVSEGNVYISTYAVYEDVRATELEIGERTRATYNLSGSKGTYDVVRTA